MAATAAKVEVKLSRSTRVYRPSEPLEGKIVVTNLSSPISHQGIRVTASGTVNLQIRAGMAGIVESFYNVVKPVSIIRKSMDIMSVGRIGSGKTEIPFSINLKSQENNDVLRFYETFHGGNISIQYLLTAEIVRGYLRKSLLATVEFIVETDDVSLLEGPLSPEMVIFYITQDTQKHKLLPELLSGRFGVTGKVSTQCSLSNTLSGEVTVEESAVPIHSIDVLLLRVESILAGGKIVSDTCVIQTTQIADGDVSRSVTLPIYVLLPRLLSCPTVLARSFSIEFQVSIVVTFKSELPRLYSKSDLRTPRPWLAMETFPLKLLRAR